MRNTKSLKWESVVWCLLFFMCIFSFVSSELSQNSRKRRKK